MSRMNTSIPMMGQQADIVGSATRGFEAGRSYRLADIYNQHGAGIASGDENALNALAQFSAPMAMQAQRGHQVMQHADAQEGRSAQTFEMQLAEYAKGLDAAQAAEQAAQIEQGLVKATQLYHAGDLQGVNMLLAEAGEQPIADLQQFPAIAAQYEKAFTVLKNVKDFSAPDKRTTIKGADGYNYYQDTGERVLPDVVAAEKTPLVDMSGMNLGTKGETEYDKERGKTFAAQMEEYETQGASARRSLYAMDAMEDAMSAPGFYSGIGAGAVSNMKRLAAAMGMDADGIADMEAFNSQAKAAALDAMGGSLGAGFSNADRDFVEDQVAGLGNTPEGNRKIIEIQRKLQQRKIDIMIRAQEYERKHGRLNKGFSAELNQWADENPLFAAEQDVEGADIQNMDLDALLAIDIDSLAPDELKILEQRFSEMNQ